MKSRPAASAICASLRLSGQLPDQRSGTRVTARPDEQFAPKSPILSRFALCMARRSAWAAAGASTLYILSVSSGSGGEYIACWRQCVAYRALTAISPGQERPRKRQLRASGACRGGFQTRPYASAHHLLDSSNDERVLKDHECVRAA